MIRNGEDIDRRLLQVYSWNVSIKTSILLDDSHGSRVARWWAQLGLQEIFDTGNRE